MKNLLIAILLAAVIGVGALAWTEHLMIASLRTALVGPDERATWQKRVWDAQKQVKQLQDKLAAAARPAAGGAGSGGGRRPPGDGRQAPARGLAGFVAFLNDPANERMLTEQQKALVDRRYAALFKTLNLTPAQLAQFKTLLAEQQNSIIDVIAADLQQGVNPMQDLGDFRQALASAEGDINAQIQSTLGPSAYTAYQNYQETLLFRNPILNLQQAMGSTAAPLTDDETAQFTNGVLAAAQSAFSPDQMKALSDFEMQAEIGQQMRQLGQTYQRSLRGD